MSGLRTSLLEQLRILGNKSGCHQRPDRSFFYRGKQFPVCARCTGVILGELAAVSLVLTGACVGTRTAALCLGVMGADWLVQEFRIRESTNPRRLLTGILGGFGLFCLYGNAAHFLLGRLKKTVFKD